jgi:hypothetical protein
MASGLHEMIFSKLNLSKEQVLDEVAFLSAHQKLSEFVMEIEYFEKRHKATFATFEKKLKAQTSSFEMENDWMSWKFAIDGKNYWTNLLNQAEK